MPKVCVELDEKTLAKALKASEEAGFKSLEEFLEFLIEEASETVQVNEEEMKEVIERLKGLGYI